MQDESSSAFVQSGESTCTPPVGRPAVSDRELPANYLDIFTPYELLLMYGGSGKAPAG